MIMDTHHLELNVLVQKAIILIQMMETNVNHVVHLIPMEDVQIVILMEAHVQHVVMDIQRMGTSVNVQVILIISIQMMETNVNLALHLMRDVPNVVLLMVSLHVMNVVITTLHLKRDVHV